MDPEVDAIVIGAGAIGLAAAASLSRAGQRVLIVEREADIARGISSRNSEVIHAGIYYPPGSQKAQLCVEGREALYARCEAQRIDHRKLGKLIVACEDEEISALEALCERGERNGVSGLRMLDTAELRRREPQVRGVAALWSPESGIVDAVGLCRSYLAEAESAGADLLLHARVVGVEWGAGVWTLGVEGDAGELERVATRAVVNAAGLDALRLAELAGLDADAAGLAMHYCKGDYFALAPSAPIELHSLVYPLPDQAGLGIHSTVDLAGRVRFGPDAHYVAAPSYDVDPERREGFAQVIRRYLPGLRSDWLSPDFAGIRPKLAGPGEGFRDFVVDEQSERGAPGWVDCLGIESPGLTASPAIAERIRALLAEWL